MSRISFHPLVLHLRKPGAACMMPRSGVYLYLTGSSRKIPPEGVVFAGQDQYIPGEWFLSILFYAFAKKYFFQNFP